VHRSRCPDGHSWQDPDFINIDIMPNQAATPHVNPVLPSAKYE
jgi:hypothetical protein